MTKTDTKTETKTETSAPLPPAAELPPATGEGAVSGDAIELPSPEGLDLAFSEAGVKRTHVGGSLPLLKFEGRKKQAFLGFFRGLTQPEGKEFTLATFDRVDHSRYLAGEPAESCVLNRLQIVNSFATKPWCGEDAENVNTGNVGKLVIVKYHGSQATGRKGSDLKLVTIEEPQQPQAKKSKGK